jgi:hypothetical protein
MAGLGVWRDMSSVTVGQWSREGRASASPGCVEVPVGPEMGWGDIRSSGHVAWAVGAGWGRAARMGVGVEWQGLLAWAALLWPRRLLERRSTRPLLSDLSSLPCMGCPRCGPLVSPWACKGARGGLGGATGRGCRGCQFGENGGGRHVGLAW